MGKETTKEEIIKQWYKLLEMGPNAPEWKKLNTLVWLGQRVGFLLEEIEQLETQISGR